jgi:hypothetical protein
MVALKIYAGQNILVGLFFKRTAAYIDTTHRVDKISILVKNRTIPTVRQMPKHTSRLKIKRYFTAVNHS